jgi:hypothetical protein
LEVPNQSVRFLVLDIMDGLTMLDEFIECSVALRQDFIWHDVLLAEDGVDVLDQLHRDDFVGQLVIVFVQKLAELEIEDEGVSVLGLDEVAAFQVYVADFPQRFLHVEAEAFQGLGLFALRLLAVSRHLLLFLVQDRVDLSHPDSEILLLVFVALYFEDFSR